MKTPMRLVKEVPEIYVDQSRDMQLLLRLMDCVYGGVKFDIDSVLNLTRTDQCKSNYLQLLQSKVGFLSDKKFDLEDLRLALSAFPWLVKNKGSKKAIKQAVNAYLKMRHIKTNFNVNVNNYDENLVDRRYLRVDYIESTGTQYINTNVIPNADFGFYVNFNTTSPITTSTDYGVIFGERKSSRKNEIVLSTYRNFPTTAGGLFRYGGIYGDSSRVALQVDPLIVPGTRQTCSLNNKIFTKTNGETFDCSSESLETTFPIFVFALNDNDIIRYYSKTKLYKLVFYEGDQVSHYYIPCVDTENNNKPGLYDTVTKEFLINSGSGEFITSNYSMTQNHVVQIGIEGNIGDTTILDEIFKYILPTGYEVEYVQYEQPETNAVELAYNDSIDYIIPSSGQNQTVGYTNQNLILQYPLVSTYDFVTLTPGTTTFGGNPATVTKDGSTVSFSLDDNYIISCNGGSYSSTIGANLYLRRNMILEKGIKYTISCKTISGTVTPGILFRTNSNYWWEADDNRIYHATSTDLGAIKRYLFISGNTSLTFIIDNNIDISNGINIYQNIPSNYAPNQFSYCIKLEKGSTATPYSVPGKRVDLMQSVGTQNLLEKEN